jgi:acetoin utilization deacetylase AcuC-like enzyme
MNRRWFLARACALMASGLSVESVIARDIRRTGLVFDEIFLTPFFSPDHPEQPARLAVAWNAIRSSGLERQMRRIPLKNITTGELRLVHTPEHIAGIRDKYGPVIDRYARAGVGGVLAACDAVHKGKARNSFVLVRPPGHHAHNAGEVVGFCLFNNVAIAARYLQRRLGYRKILIVDWDFHHGDGTEAFFYDDPSVLYFSTHRLESYPRTGDPERRGEGAGLGYNINVALDCGAGDREIIQAFENQLMPAALRFTPDFILISAGFDSRIDDTLGCFNITDQGYDDMTELVKTIARKSGHERIVSALEGGYHLPGLASGIQAHIRALMR